MKDYKRLTDRYECNMCDAVMCAKYCDDCDAKKNFMRLAELEDKIESGELVNITELMVAETTRDLTEKEIEFFIKHNEEVRKETAREILERIKNMKKNGYTYEAMIAHLYVEYGVDLEDEE